jgi:hypothetical protein
MALLYNQTRPYQKATKAAMMAAIEERKWLVTHTTLVTTVIGNPYTLRHGMRQRERERERESEST